MGAHGRGASLMIIPGGVQCHRCCRWWGALPVCAEVFWLPWHILADLGADNEVLSRKPLERSPQELQHTSAGCCQMGLRAMLARNAKQHRQHGGAQQPRSLASMQHNGGESHPLSIAAGIKRGHIKEVEAILLDSQMHSRNCLILIWALRGKAASAERPASKIAGGLQAVVGSWSPLTPYAWPKGLHPRPTTEHCTPVLPNACRGSR